MTRIAAEPVAAPERTAVVAIDGPSGSGKSTVARRVAQRLGFRYLDTGAMYRALTWQALERRVDLEDAAALSELAERAHIDPGTNPRRPSISIDGTDVSAPIRSRAVTNAVSAVSAVPAVRAALVRRQRELMADGGIVVEGRDIGTTVAPDAPLKIFLTASSEARAQRRHRQFTATGDAAAVDDTRAEIERRDERDSTRASSPLVQAPDAVVVDSTTRTVDEVVREVLAVAGRRGLLRRRRGSAPQPDAAPPNGSAPARAARGVTGKARPTGAPRTADGGPAPRARAQAVTPAPVRPTTASRRAADAEDTG